MRRNRFAFLFFISAFLHVPLAHAQNYPPMKSAFPKVISGAGTSRGNPLVADLGLTPGHKSIIFGTVTGRIYVVRWDGTVHPNFPVQLAAPAPPVDGSPAAGDLTGDGIPEIVVGYGSLLDPSKRGGICAYKLDGSLLWNRPSGDFNSDGVPDPVPGAPVIADVDADGQNEVVWGSLDARVYVAKGSDGTDKPGWPIFVRDTVFSSPALHDFDGDGRLEIVIGVDSHTEPAPFNTVAGGYLHVFYSTGQPSYSPSLYDPPNTRTIPAPELPGFPKYVDQTVFSAPSVGDIDGDGEPEIVVGTGLYYTTGSRNVYAFNCDGSPSTGWPVAVDGWVATSPALADLDGDGLLDVVVTDDATPPSTAHHVWAFRGIDGHLLWKTVPKSFFGTSPNAYEPVVADVLGDSKPEVLVPVNTEVCVLDGATGTQLTESTMNFTGKVSFYTPTTVFGVAATDFESDGVAIEVVTVSGTPFPSATDGYVTVFNPVKSAPPAEGPWGLYRQSARRRGVAPGTSACEPPPPPSPLDYYSLSPCRILDTRDPVGPYGGPAIAAGARRSFAVLGRCSIPVDAKSLTVNVTVIDPTSPGGLRLFGGTGVAPNTFVLLFRTGLTRAGQAMVEVKDGVITVMNTQTTGSVHIALDVSGVFR